MEYSSQGVPFSPSALSMRLVCAMPLSANSRMCGHRRSLLRARTPAYRGGPGRPCGHADAAGGRCPGPTAALRPAAAPISPFTLLRVPHGQTPRCVAPVGTHRRAHGAPALRCAPPRAPPVPGRRLWQPRQRRAAAAAPHSQAWAGQARAPQVCVGWPAGQPDQVRAAKAVLGLARRPPERLGLHAVAVVDGGVTDQAREQLHAVHGRVLRECARQLHHVLDLRGGGGGGLELCRVSGSSAQWAAARAVPAAPAQLGSGAAQGSRRRRATGRRARRARPA